MNKSLYYIIPFAIALIGLIAWLLNCPMSILIPLITSLGAAYLGWRLGIAGLDYVVANKDKEIGDYKNQLAIASTTITSPPLETSVDEADTSEMLVLKNTIKALESDKQKIQEDWQSKFKVLEAKQIDEQNTLEDWRLKYDELLDQHTQSVKEWEAKYATLQERNQSMQTSILSASEGQVALTKYNELKLSYDQALEDWNQERKALENKLTDANKTIVNEVDIIEETPTTEEKELIKEEAPSAMLKEEKFEITDDIDALMTKVESINLEEISIEDQADIVDEIFSENLETIDGDDLTKIKGISPAAKKILNKNGIMTFSDLSKVNKSALLGMLDAGGAKFKDLNPKSWAEQAKLAAKGQWEKLQKLQDKTA